MATGLSDRPTTIDQPLPATEERNATSPPERVRLDFVDGLRAVAALFVLLGHAYYQPANGYYSGRIITHLGLTYGHLAVVVFIVVSGFCLGLPSAARGDQLGSLKQFFLRRARRILPPYYACLLLSMLFIRLAASAPTGTVWDNSLPLSRQQALSHLLLVHDLPAPWQAALAAPLGANDLRPGEHGDINYPLWSIAVEWQLYLLMPLIVLSIRRAGAGVTLLWTIAAGLGIHVLSKGFLDTATPWYLGQFTMGLLAARACMHSRVPGWGRPVCYVTLAGTAVTLLLKGKGFHDHYEPYIDTVMAAAAALLLAVTYTDVKVRQHGLTRILSWKPLVAVGLFSYSLYLVHAPLLHALDSLFVRWLHPNPETRFGLLVLASPIIIGAAYLFHLTFERRFIKGRGQ